MTQPEKLATTHRGVAANQNSSAAHPKFTRGPWTVSTAYHGAAISKDGCSLAAVWPESLNGTQFDAEANAHLIAAAPDMYEALKVFADCCDQIAEDESDEEWAKFRLLVSDYRRAHDVLAKARGGAA